MIGGGGGGENCHFIFSIADWFYVTLFDFSFINYFSLEFKLFDFSSQVGRELMRPNENQQHSFDTNKLETDNFTLKS